VQLLVDHGARLDVPNLYGETPLFLAEVVIQFAGGGRTETGPTSTGTLLRKLGANRQSRPIRCGPTIGQTFRMCRETRSQDLRISRSQDLKSEHCEGKPQSAELAENSRGSAGSACSAVFLKRIFNES
jgi:hypothetical protein